MANMMHIPVLGVVENFSYLKCPDCGKQIKLFGESHIDEVAAGLGTKVLESCRLIRSMRSMRMRASFTRWRIRIWMMQWMY